MKLLWVWVPITSEVYSYKCTKYMKGNCANHSLAEDNWRWAKVVSTLHLSFFLLLQRRVWRILFRHILVGGVFWKACKKEEHANRYKYHRTPFQKVNALPTNRKEEPPARLPCYVAGGMLRGSTGPSVHHSNLRGQTSRCSESTRGQTRTWRWKVEVLQKRLEVGTWHDDHEWDNQIICVISFGWSRFGWSTLG